jgi:SprT protein
VQLSLFQPQSEPVPSHPSYLKALRLLEKHLPPASLDQASRAVAGEEVVLKISPGRATKSGDFRPGHEGKSDRISVNKTLNPSAFLVTLLHELAHVRVHRRFTPSRSIFRRPKKKYQPHGTEWKDEFRVLMEPYLTLEVFPAEVLEALRRHMQNPRASTFSDLRLSRVLGGHEEDPGGLSLESLPQGTVFEIPSGRRFVKQEKKRKRFLCLCLDNKRNYLFSPLAKVKIITS